MPLVHESPWRRWRLIIISVLFCVLVVCGVIEFWLNAKNSAAHADAQEFTYLTNETNTMSSNSKYDQAAQLWISYAVSTKNRQHKTSAYVNAAALYISNNQYSQAVVECKKAEGVSGVTYEEAYVAANAYYSLNDKPDAIHYYQEAIRLIPNSISDRSAEIGTFNEAIESMQGAQ